MIVEAEHSSQTDCHIRVSRKIIVNLQGVQQHTKPCPCYRQGGKVCVQIVSRQRACHIGDHYLFGQSQTEACDTLAEILCRYGAVLDFSSNIAVTDDWSCYQLVIAGKIHQIFIVSLLCCNLSAVDIQHIADSLEGVKGNTDRQSNLRHRQRKSGQQIDVFYHKSAVLKDAQHTKVKHQRRNQRYLFAALLSGQIKIFDTFCPGVVQESGQHQQKHPDRFAPGIEKERKKKQNHIFPGFVWNGII